MSKIVITEFMDEAAVERLKPAADVVYDPKLVDRPDDMAAAIVDASAVIVRNRTQVRGALLEGAGALRVVGRLGVGLDNIDVAACEDRGIQVIPATGANAAAVAEYVIGSLFVLLRGSYRSTEAVLAGDWPRPALSSGGEVMGRTLGLIGFGGIARETVRRARALGMPVIAFDPNIPASDPVWAAEGVTPVGLGAVLAESDAISLHVPLTDATRNLIDEAALSRMRPTAVLVNSARGNIVDEAALAQALRNGRLAGAAMDVFAVEPLPADSPLSGAPNLLLTPHIAGVTRESNARVSHMIAEHVAAGLGLEALS